MAYSLEQAMTDAVIRRLAGADSYQRGREYFSDGRVESVEQRADPVRALVRGNQDYAVTLASGDGGLDYSCDCPVGRDGDFCKHCVAAALAWLKRAAGPPRSPRRGKPKDVTLADAGEILHAEEKEAL